MSFISNNVKGLHFDNLVNSKVKLTFNSMLAKIN